MVIILISTCKHKLHEDEFVRPVFDIVKSVSDEKVEVVHYDDLSDNIIGKSSCVIICGTALLDFDYMDDLNKFEWIKSYDKALLGICAGAQLIGVVNGAEIKKGCEIGMIDLEILSDDDLFDSVNFNEVYSLHNSYCEVPKGFELLAKSQKYPQVFSNGKVYGVLFHGEVKNKKLIENFVGLL